ncbi:LysR family transcriptional regulator [Ramlibacter sp.]|uniref:LysR family transcriptional regulator n=1 Tax=Ramlibacter sp. TaxID=1917967 RepID=UPI003D0B6B6E
MTVLSAHTLTRRIDLFTLRLFLTIVEEQQIRRAALRENIAPSAATRRVHELEEVAGISLFDRQPNGMVTTPAGEVLARHVRLMFANLDVMGREVAQFTEGVRGHISISSTSAIIVQLLAPRIAEFAREFPLIDIELREEPNVNVVNAVLAGHADIAMFYATSDIDAGGLDVVECRTDRLAALVPRGHPLAERTSVTMRDLLDEVVIGIGPTTSLMVQARKAAEALGRQLPEKYRVTTVEAARSLVKAGLGVMVHPDCMLPTADLDRMELLRLDEPWAVRMLCAGTKRGEPVTAAAKAFIAQLVDK